ncbi:MAG TPA: hypothetical protein VFY87_08520 [Geminicoccaceae bacterium]|nr:hypothetical protein [Geminicoccaceae bacterium]
MLWERAGGRCEVSGLEFTDEKFPEALVARPFAPSLDRIVPRGDYTVDNVRLVCVRANFSMTEWGLDTLVRLADTVIDHHRRSAIRDRLTAIWRARLEARIEEALTACDRMSADEARRYCRRVAGLRRALTLSRTGLRAAAAKACAARATRPRPAGA